jgi:bacterioferritin-associated ferredoxin
VNITCLLLVLDKDIDKSYGLSALQPYRCIRVHHESGFEAVHCSAPVRLMQLRQVTGCRRRCGEAARTVTAVVDPDLTQAISGLPAEPRTSNYGSGRAVVKRTSVVLMASQASWWDGPKDRGHSRSVGRL